MESRRTFPGGVSAESSAGEKKLRSGSTPDISRRQFGKLLGAAAGALLSEKTGRAESVAARPMKEEKKECANERELYESFSKLYVSLRATIAEVCRDVVENEQSPLLWKDDDAGLQLVHAMFSKISPEQRFAHHRSFIARAKPAIESFLGQVKAYADTKKTAMSTAAALSERFDMQLGSSPSVKTSPEAWLRTLEELLSRCDAQGLVYAFQSKIGAYPKPKDQRQNHRSYYRFAAMTTDFLPQAHDLSENDIEPFFKAEDAQKDDGDQKAYWREKDMQARFRAALEDDAVRKLLSATPDLPLSGAYSLVKSAIEYHIDYAPAESVSDILTSLLLERTSFSKEILIDRSTHVVGYYGYDEFAEKVVFDKKPMNELCAALGVAHVDEFDAYKGKTYKKDFLKCLERTRGKTFIYLHMHGGEKTISPVVMWDEKRTTSIADAEVCRVLAKRFLSVLAEEGPDAARKTLGDMTIASTTCEGYNFYQNLFRTIKDRYQDHFDEELRSLKTGDKKGWERQRKTMSDWLATLTFSEISFPRLIGGGQKNRPVVGTYPIDGYLNRRKESLVRAGRVTGADILIDEPLSYDMGNDLSIFSTQGGKLHQISAVERPSSPDRASA